MKFTDHQLSAFLDGELPDNEARALEVALKDDPQLREALARLQNVDDLLCETFGEIIDEPVPPHIVDLIHKGSHTSDSPSLVSLSAWRSKLSEWRASVSLAASVLFGLVVGTQFSSPTSGQDQELLLAGLVNSGSALHSVLETLPSGQSENGFSPSLSFISHEGVCREVSATGQRALACRDSHSQWEVLVVISQSLQASADGYQTASSESSIVLDVLADQLMSDAPLSADEERDMIAIGWDNSNQSSNN
jgi:hypothetical protein